MRAGRRLRVDIKKLSRHGRGRGDRRFSQGAFPTRLQFQVSDKQFAGVGEPGHPAAVAAPNNRLSPQRSGCPLGQAAVQNPSGADAPRILQRLANPSPAASQLSVHRKSRGDPCQNTGRSIIPAANGSPTLVRALAPARVLRTSTTHKSGRTSRRRSLPSSTGVH